MQGYTLIVHGPEAFDKGDVLNVVGQTCPAQVVIAGIIARTAALEAGFTIPCPNERPSVLLNRYGRDAALLNRGKSVNSGMIFGESVAQRTDKKSLVQIECSNSTVYLWGQGNYDLAEYLSLVLSYKLITKPVSNLSLTEFRIIKGCFPGEPVFVNGTIIGIAESEEVTIRLNDNEIIPVFGLKLKEHGMQRVKISNNSDIYSLWIKSGSLRGTLPVQSPRSRITGKIIVIDHESHRFWERISDDVAGILTIGDDTTSVTGHMSAHLGIPVFGITDGDEDGIIRKSFTEGSVIVKSIEGRDDDIGKELISRIPNGEVHWDSWVNDEIERLGDRVVVIQKV